MFGTILCISGFECDVSTHTLASMRKLNRKNDTPKLSLGCQNVDNLMEAKKPKTGNQIGLEYTWAYCLVNFCCDNTTMETLLLR